MSGYHLIGGRTFRVRTTIKLAAAERAALVDGGLVTLVRPVEWPLPDATPHFERAYVDRGGTDIWGPGPYLKVPNWSRTWGEELINRVFCPWGYPPRRLRVERTTRRVRIERIELARLEAGGWHWLLYVREAKIAGRGTILECDASRRSSSSC